jgi:hypothetical protein
MIIFDLHRLNFEHKWCTENPQRFQLLRFCAESDGLRTGFRRKPDSIPMIADSR